MSDTKRMLSDLFIDIFNQILALEEKVLSSGSNVSITETHVLEAIKKCDPPTMGIVAGKLLITPGTLTTSVNKLIDKGYVTRHRSEVDRRIVTLSLTDEGEEIFKLHEEFHEEMIAAAVEDLECHEDLKKALESMNDFFQRLRDKY